MGKRKKILVKCDNCSKQYEVNQETYNKNIVNNKPNFCISCRHVGDLTVGVKRKVIRPKKTITCECCGNSYNMTIVQIEERFDRFGKHLCIECAKKGDMNPFFNKKFNDDKLTELSNIRSEYYNHEEYGSLRREEQRQRFSGKNNPMYVGSGLRSEYTWRNKTYRLNILRIFDNTCVKCNNKLDDTDLRVHHLNSCDWDIKGIMDLSNGVCLCNECHKDFHKIYGYGKNTEQQFDEWMNEGSETIETV